MKVYELIKELSECKAGAEITVLIRDGESWAEVESVTDEGEIVNLYAGEEHDSDE
jgi:hypothetical protein